MAFNTLSKQKKPGFQLGIKAPEPESTLLYKWQPMELPVLKKIKQFAFLIFFKSNLINRQEQLYVAKISRWAN